jgi:hypothetical protein
MKQDKKDSDHKAKGKKMKEAKMSSKPAKKMVREKKLVGKPNLVSSELFDAVRESAIREGLHKEVVGDVAKKEAMPAPAPEKKKRVPKKTTTMGEASADMIREAVKTAVKEERKKEPAPAPAPAPSKAPRKPRFEKGSQEARDFMARVRAGKSKKDVE